MTDPVQIATDGFAQGFNCSQSVFYAFASRLGISDETALKLASPFGGGVAHQGDVCGAVSGALMALGLRWGNTTVEQKDETYRLAEDFIQRFRTRHGSILCRELIAYDISTPDGLQSAREHKVFQTICPGLVRDATEVLADFLK